MSPAGRRHEEIGPLSGAVCAASRLPPGASRWPDTVPLSAGVFLLACACLAWWRASLAPGREDDESNGRSVGEVFAYLHGCRDEAVRIRDEFPTLDAETAFRKATAAAEQLVSLVEEKQR
jgi:hypothetical protein